jgi:branched-chain amino acid transport system ATP-binding protein
MSLISVSGLSKVFGGVQAISDVNFSITGREIFSVIGPNGAGKTTLFNLLTGIYRPSAGSIYLGERKLNGLEPFRIAQAGITRTFQNLQVFMNMTVLENVMVGCHMRSGASLAGAALRLPSVIREERTVRKMAMEALTQCSMEEFAERDASSLPYGMLKKLEIARALAIQPAILLLDEPAAGLNDTETMELSSLIKKIRDTGITIILVEHNMGLVMDISDRLLVLNYGRVIASGQPDEIQRNPDVIAAYLGEDQ